MNTSATSSSFRQLRSVNYHESGDSITTKRAIHGRVTPRRWEIIKLHAKRSNVGRIHCGCSHDCCGHLCSQYSEVTFCNGSIILETQQNFNY